MKLQILLAVLIVSGITVVNAQETGNWTKVVQIYTPLDGGNVFVYFDQNSMPGCYSNKGAYLIANDQVDTDKIYSALLAAKMSDSDVQPFFEIVGSNPDSWGRCHITALYLK